MSNGHRKDECFFLPGLSPMQLRVMVCVAAWVDVLHTSSLGVDAGRHENQFTATCISSRGQAKGEAKTGVKRANREHKAAAQSTNIRQGGGKEAFRDHYWTEILVLTCTKWYTSHEGNKGCRDKAPLHYVGSPEYTVINPALSTMVLGWAQNKEGIWNTIHWFVFFWKEVNALKSICGAKWKVSCYLFTQNRTPVSNWQCTKLN